MLTSIITFWEFVAGHICRRLGTVAAAAKEGTQALERTSLVPQTLRELSEDSNQQALMQRLQRDGQAALTKEERRKRQRSLDGIGAPSFPAVLKVGSGMSSSLP
jgi:hypothetical protein